MKSLSIVFGILIISFMILISCQQQEPVQKKANEHGVAVQTFEKAKDTMGEYIEKTEGAI